MKNLLIILGVVAVLAAGLLYFFTGFNFSTPPQQTATTTSSTIPSQPDITVPTSLHPTASGQTQSTLAVASVLGGSIAVNDFTKSPSTIADTNNKGLYALSGGLDPTDSNAPYSIIYQSADQSFIVSLLTEPLGQTRQAAEQELVADLGISEAEMCALRYWVGVSYDINSVYSGKNLGFSFCPSAVNLP